MNKSEVLDLLEKNKNQRGIDNWGKMKIPLKSFGIGMTQLKKLAKQIGRNHELALELWETSVYESKLLATLIDEPKKVTEEQVDKQVKELEFWMMSYAYCSNLLPKTSFVKEKAVAWATSDDKLLRRCGYALLYELSKDKKVEDEYFEPYLEIIENSIQKEDNFVKDAMNMALFGLGKRSAKMNTKSLDIAKSIGKIVVDYGDNSCEAIDCVKHLSNEKLIQKLNQ
jgi:3-methyladenine DNA glycosylase AlkD